MNFQYSSLGHPSLALKYTGKPTFFPGTPSWGMTLEDFKFSKNTWPKFYHLPILYGRKSFVNNAKTLPYREGSVSFGYCTAVACRTKNQNTSNAHGSVFKAVTKWGGIMGRTYPLEWYSNVPIISHTKTKMHFEDLMIKISAWSLWDSFSWCSKVWKNLVQV